MSVGIDTL